MKSVDLMIVDCAFTEILPLIQLFPWTNCTAALSTYSTKKFIGEQVNDNRKLTKMRSVVERVNARLEQYEYFDKVIVNTALPKMHEYVKIVCALINGFCPPLVHETSNDHSIAEQMLPKSNNEERCSVKRRWQTVLKLNRWEDIKLSLIAPSFPLLKITEVEELTSGIFEIKQAGHTNICRRTSRRAMNSCKFRFRQSEKVNVYGLN